MNGLTDQQLIRDYAEHRSDAAFAALVHRHLDLVYSAALRMVRDTHHAEDVTQGVFTALAQNASQLVQRPVLSGWLHRTAQNLAANVVRAEVRRQAREQEAAAMQEVLSSHPDTAWDDIAPHLDAALGELSEPDRDALLLRYFEHKSAREMADLLGVSAEASQKRVNRAVDRLREFFAKSGITVGTGGLVAVISANAVQAAPAGLAATVAAAATLAGTTCTAAVATTTATTKAIAMTTLQKTLVTATIAVLAGVGIYEAREISALRRQVQSLEQQRPQTPAAPGPDTSAALQQTISQLTTQNTSLADALAQANTDKSRLEQERESAKRAAALFQELAEQSKAKETSPTNAYPTARHVWTTFGKMGRLAALSKQDESKLSPEEKAALETARTKALEELPKLIKAAKYFTSSEPSDTDTQPEKQLDLWACMLYGALNLDEQQFSQVYGLMQKGMIEAKQKGLSNTNSTPEKTVAMQQLLEQFKGELQPLLNEEQASIFADVLTHVQIETGNFGFSFGF